MEGDPFCLSTEDFLGVLSADGHFYRYFSNIALKYKLVYFLLPSSIILFN